MSPQPHAHAAEQRPHRMALWLHRLILATFTLGLAYTAWMVFFILAPDAPGPLLGRATETSADLMMARRLYAIEGWITFAGFCIYLAVTEVVPRLHRRPDS
ncbi:MAG: hypothetical protein EA398_11510 [Deltaproteobacteria bacterium]|nr:MAG: hypothetical protein EA398_11510 [Deltaproteobacteria bacterium]